MSKATLLEVRDWFSVPMNPVTMTEMKELTKEDREELAVLVGEALGKP